MRLRGIDFGPVWGASGVQNFFGEGYPFHSAARRIGLDFTGMTFIAKTTTLEPRAGNMPMRSDGVTPMDLLPSCIWVGDRRDLWRGWRKGYALNSVGLSGPGAEALIGDGRWQMQPKPFMLSFMAVDGSSIVRLEKMTAFCKLLAAARANFCAPFALQLNYSCPNVGLSGPGHAAHIEEVRTAVRIVEAVLPGVPVVIKESLTTPTEVMIDVGNIDGVDCLLITNTIPWWQLTDEIHWERLFDTTISPLKKRNPRFTDGGLSGKPLYIPLLFRLSALRTAGFKKALNAGGGVTRPSDVAGLRMAGANGVSLGSIAFLRPWRVRKTIQAAHEEPWPTEEAA